MLSLKGLRFVNFNGDEEKAFIQPSETPQRSVNIKI